MLCDNPGLCFSQWETINRPGRIDICAGKVIPGNEGQVSENGRKGGSQSDSNVSIVGVPILPNQSLVLATKQVVIVAGNFMVILRRKIQAPQRIPVHAK